MIFACNLFETVHPANCVRNTSLGNNLFKIAAVVGAANTFSAKWCISDWEHAECFNYSWPFCESAEHVIVCEEDAPGRYTPIVPPVNNELLNGLYLVEGYRQSYKYFENCAADIRDMFQPTAAVKEAALAQTSNFFDKHEEVISVHVRRGDYLDWHGGNTLPLSYYAAAFNRFDKEAAFLIISDDPDWCDTMAADLLPERAYHVVRGNAEVQDMYLISCCRHHINSNSTFAWWGAWLNARSKRVIVPAHWWPDAVMDDRIPADWEQLNQHEHY